MDCGAEPELSALNTLLTLARQESASHSCQASAPMKRTLTRLIFPCLCLAVLAWFHWNSVNGKRGEVQIAQTGAAIAKTRLEFEGLIASRETLSRKVALLRSDGLDPDLLGIRARKMLHHSHPDELIVYLPKPVAEQ